MSPKGRIATKNKVKANKSCSFIDKRIKRCHNDYGSMKQKYKHNKRIAVWRRANSKIALATTVTGCCAVGYIVSLAFASPAPPSSIAENPDAKRPGVVSSADSGNQSPSGTPTPSVSATPTAPSPSAAATRAPTATPAATPKPFVPGPDLYNATKKNIAMQLVSSAENSSLNWQAQYGYIEDIGDGRGYTGGIIGFCSGTGDMLEVVTIYAGLAPGNALAAFIPALTAVNGTASHAGLDTPFTTAWVAAAADAKFQQAQNTLRDNWYFNPAVSMAVADGVHALGQFIYYDAMVMHGPGYNPTGFYTIRANAMAAAKTPAQGGDETTYLHAFLNARKTAMLAEPAHSNTDRVDNAQRVFLNAGNLNLDTPLSWSVYGDAYHIN